MVQDSLIDKLGISLISFAVMEDTTDVGDHRLIVRFSGVDVPSVETVGISQLPAVVAFFLLTLNSYQSRGFLLPRQFLLIFWRPGFLSPLDWSWAFLPSLIFIQHMDFCLRGFYHFSLVSSVRAGFPSQICPSSIPFPSFPSGFSIPLVVCLSIRWWLAKYNLFMLLEAIGSDFRD